MGRELRWAFAVFVLAFFFRTLFMEYVSGPGGLWDDSYHHLTIARSVYDGRGFVTDVIWPLNMRSDGFPMGYFFRQPVYPSLLALSYHLFGAGLLSARLVSLFCEALIAAVTFLIGWELSKSLRVAFFSALTYLFAFFPIYMSPQVMSDSSFSLFVVLCFYVVIRDDSTRGRLVLGAIVALAYLTREQGLVLLPALTAFYSSKSGLWGGLRKAAYVALVAFLLVCPWLLRVYSLTGNPLHNANSDGFLLYGELDRFFAEYDAPKGKVDLFFERLNAETLSKWSVSMWFLAWGHMLILPNLLVLPIVYFERARLMGHARENAGFYRMAVAYYLILLAATSVMYGLVRYLYSVIPLVAVVSAVCLEGFLRVRLFSSLFLWEDLFQTALVVLVLFSNVGIAKSIIAGAPTHPDISAANWLVGKVGGGDVVMGDFPYYAPYILGVKGVQIPSDEMRIIPVAEQYNVTYVIHGYARRWYNITDESRLIPVHDGGNWTVYRFMRGVI